VNTPQKPFNLRNDVWSGVFNSHSEALSSIGHEEHASSVWIQKCLDRLTTAKIGQVVEQSKVLPEWAYPVDVLVALALGKIDAQRPLSVLDVGGNLGQLAVLAQQWFQDVKFDWTVLELPQVCEAFQLSNHHADNLGDHIRFVN